MRREYIEPILAPFDNLSDPLRFQNGRFGFQEVRIHQRDEESRIHSVYDLDEDDIAPFLTKPQNLFATDFPITMGIVNVTPDSFSDGGLYANGENAMRHAQNLTEQGASLLDFGAESTRPGSEAVPVGEEIDRLMPIFDDMQDLQVPVSIDTRKHEVALEAIGAGAQMINDVSALSFDEQMAETLARTDVSVCLMHAQGDPKTMQDQPNYDNVVLDVFDYLEERIEFAESMGIARERLVIDPGIGFGKTLDHNLALLRHISLFHALGCPILLGASRKSMISKIHPSEADARLGGSLAIALDASSKAVQILRVHDVQETVQALRVQDRILRDQEEIL